MTIRRFFRRMRCFLPLAALATTVAACDGDDGSTSTGANGGSAGGAVEDLNERARDLAQEAREAWNQLVADLQARLARWQPEIEQIRTFAREKADPQLDRILTELDEKTAAARAKIAEIGEDLASATEDERAELNRLMDEAADALQRAKARLQEIGGELVSPPSLSGGGTSLNPR
jgi:hypothetical protein